MAEDIAEAVCILADHLHQGVQQLALQEARRDALRYVCRGEGELEASEADMPDEIILMVQVSGRADC